MNKKRLFFAFEIDAPWPESLPKGRILDESHRHMTVAFLGDIDFDTLKDHLFNVPKIPLQVGLTGYFDRILFLPKRHPNVAAWHVKWLDEAEILLKWQKEWIDWLKGIGFSFKDNRDFLPHVTICRSPFNEDEWKSDFGVFPLSIVGLHLYESLGNLKYEPIWSYPQLKRPFEEIEHTADIAFDVFGENMDQLFVHAFTALAFKFPPLLKFNTEKKVYANLDEMIWALNHIVSLTDAEIGCPFKAVSYHGEIEKDTNNILKWRMIVDV